MRRYYIAILLFFIFLTRVDLSAAIQDFPGKFSLTTGLQDTLKENQVLYNGKIWSNIYYMVDGDQFFYSRMFLPGSLTINGIKFTNIPLKYDILNDEILTPVDTGGIVQLNKEMVDSFSVLYQNKKYQFISMQEDSTIRLKSYFNVLYKGKTSLYLRYYKKIDKLHAGENNDKFYQFTRIFFVKDNIIYPINGKGDLLKILVEEKERIKNFIRKNKLDVSEKEPGSFIPIIRFYDSIIH
jgi:hypothetical protein